MYTHILIATDGSALAEKAIRAGVDLAKASGAKLTIVTISEAFPAYDLGTKLGLFRDQAAIDSYEADCRAGAEVILKGAAETAAAAGVACETLHVADSAPAAGILETAKARGCDLIVLTSNGRQGLERFIMGSQAARVAQGAETSVLIVR